MEKIWKIILEGEKGDDISLTGIDTVDIIGIGTLNSRYISALKWNIENKPHYRVIGRVKSLESSAGDQPDVHTVGVILATAVGDDIEMGLFFIKAAKGSYQVIALWPDDFARACKVKKDLYKRLIVSLVQNSAFFAKVSIVLPPI